MSTATAASTTPRAEIDALLIEAGTGSVDAFADLYDRVAPLVYGLSVAALRDPSTAERATEAVFTQLWRSAPRYKSERQDPIPFILTLSYQVISARS